MRIAIVGAGAIGGTLAALLAKAGAHDVSLLARGAHLAAIRGHGLTLDQDGVRHTHRLNASDDPAALGVRDMVVLTVKGHSLPALAPLLGPLLAPRTIVVCAQNGIPWWFFAGLEAPERDQPLPVVDPGGAVWKALSGARTVGCMIQIPASVPEPGVVAHGGRQRALTFGTPRKGADPEALAACADVFGAADVKAVVEEDIRTVVWTKLVQNAFFGPASALTLARNGAVDTAPGMREIRTRVVDELIAVAAAWGSALAPARAKLLAPNTNPEHKTSMLQDFEAGRPLEIGPILAAPLDLGARRKIDMPTLATLHALVALRMAPKA
ncbi:MAG: 2-dehydropantoate 2-reductase [Alphaproteobacteria bacterium]|nr:2-dehydropantoate 2-reductase [Alphaproteobacteria bacterium]